MLGHNVESNSLSLSVEEVAVELLEIKAERHNLLLRLNTYRASSKKMERRLSEQDDILKTMTASMKHLEKKVTSLENKKRHLESTSEELVRRHGGEGKVVGRSVRKPVISVGARSIRVMMCIIRAFSKRCLKEITDQNYFSEYLHRNWTRPS